MESLLKMSLTLTQPQAFLYADHAVLTNDSSVPSFLKAHYTTATGIESKAFSNLQMQSLFLLLLLNCSPAVIPR